MATMVAADPLVPTKRSVAEEALFEVFKGEIVELAPMSIYAICVAANLQDALSPFAKRHKLGRVLPEALFILDAEHDERRRPDLAFVSAEKWPLTRAIPLTGDWEVVPDLAVEVISPNDIFEKVLAKLEEYFQFGVGQVWLILPRQKQFYIYESLTQVRILTATDELDGGTLLPGLRLPLGPIFQTHTDNGTPMN